MDCRVRPAGDCGQAQCCRRARRRRNGSCRVLDRSHFGRRRYRCDGLALNLQAANAMAPPPSGLC